MPTLAEHRASQRCPICGCPTAADGRFGCMPHDDETVRYAIADLARSLVASATVNGVRVVPGHMLPAFEALVRAIGYRACEHDEQRRCGHEQ